MDPFFKEKVLSPFPAFSNLAWHEAQVLYFVPVNSVPGKTGRGDMPRRICASVANFCKSSEVSNRQLNVDLSVVLLVWMSGESPKV
mgnify:CR=1 FL=1